jgi:hypothetical protein
MLEKGGSIAELVERPPTVLKVGGSNLSAYLCFIRTLFIQIVNRREVSNYTYVSYGFDTSNHFNLSKSVKVCLHIDSCKRP